MPAELRELPWTPWTSVIAQVVILSNQKLCLGFRPTEVRAYTLREHLSSRLNSGRLGGRHG